MFITIMRTSLEEDMEKNEKDLIFSISDLTFRTYSMLGLCRLNNRRAEESTVIESMLRA